MKRVVLWVVALSILYSTLSIVRHNHFQSGGFDLGLYDQEVWQYSQFLAPYNTVKERFIYGDHLTLTLPFLAPLFWIWNDVRILLVFQALWISFSVLAVYKLVRLRKFSPFIAVALSFIYSLFYGIQYGIFFDFHPVLLAVGLIPWMLYFLESKKKALFIISVILLLLTQENMGLALASLGFIYFFHKKFRKTAVFFIVGGIVASFIAVTIINRFYPFQYVPQISTNPLDLFNAPEKQQVWLYTFASFSFLPILSPGAILAILFDLSQYFMSGPEFARMWSPFMHHRAILAPYVLLGTLDALALLKKHARIIVMGLVVSAIAQQYIFHLPLNKLAKAEFWKTQSWEKDNQEMLATIPPTMNLATQQSLIPHLSHRTNIYLFWPRVHDQGWWLDTNNQAQYLLVDTHPYEWLTMLLESPEHVNEALVNMQKAGVLMPVKRINDIQLFKIVYPESPR